MLVFVNSPCVLSWKLRARTTSRTRNGLATAFRLATSPVTAVVTPMPASAPAAISAWTLVVREALGQVTVAPEREQTAKRFSMRYGPAGTPSALKARFGPVELVSML